MDPRVASSLSSADETTMTIRSKARILLPLLALGLAAFIYHALLSSKTERQKPQLAEKVWQIEALTAAPQSLAPSVTLYGHIESPERLQAGAPGPGVVERVFVRNGTRVQRDEPLIRLDPRDFEAALRQSEADYRDVENQLDELQIRHRADRAALDTERELMAIAEAEVERLVKLQQQNLSTDTALNSARSELERRRLAVLSRELDVASYPARLKALEARRDRARARVDQDRLAFDRAEISAPFDAIVSRVTVAAGDRVAIGQVLLELFPFDSLEIRAHLPLKYMDTLRRALAAGQTLRARVTRAGTDRSFALLRLAGEAEATGIDIYFDASESGESLRPGELLALDLELPREDDVYALPYQAIYGNSRIYRVIDDRLQALDVVSVGQTRDADGGTLVLIRSDRITPGDRIATTHLPNAVTGLKVRIDGE